MSASGTVFVAIADCGLNGPDLIGSFATRPDREQVKRWYAQYQGVTGFQLITVTECTVEP